MTDLRQAAQQALEALESGDDVDPIFAGETISGLRKALEQPEQGPVASIYISQSGEREFDDWKCKLPIGRNLLYTTQPEASPEQEPTCPECKAAVLYECVACSSNNYPPVAQPPPEWEAINNIIAEYGLDAIAFVAEWKAAQRPWVGLEPEEILDLFDISNVYGSKWIEFARTVEAKLRSKNGH